MCDGKKTLDLTSDQETSRVDLDSMHHIAMLLARSLNLQEMYQIIVHIACELTQTPHGFFYVVNEELDKLELKYGQGLYQCYQGVTRTRQEPSVSSTVWKTGQLLMVENIQQWHSRADDRPYGWDIVHSVLGIPLLLDSGVIGVIGLGFSSRNRASIVREIDLLERFAALAALSLRNAELHSVLQAEWLERKAAWQKQLPNMPDLTGKEKAVLIRMARGLSNQEIAQDLGVELSTVKTHAHHMFGKLEVRSRAQALIKAWQFGLIAKSQTWEEA
ncbi:GAF domain-containing protein [Sporomusa malonica]|uniref:Regulatory protein, luxR family n=1 Tax=Sporomusa malonica TaxID=112901 RepID=A0A1W1YSW1_9FIRM|nr:GAF domain-containing protein [Sporomusa malonica]SMC39192.1 regulatory protein, luxR family [Sporomusa malonica]